MQNNKLSVSRNGNQSGPRATWPESGRGSWSVASQRPESATLGAGAKSSKRSRAGHAVAKDRRVRFGAKSSSDGGTVGCPCHSAAQETHDEAAEIGRLTVRARKSVLPPRLSILVVLIAGQTDAHPIPTACVVVGGVSATEWDRSTDGVQPPILEITPVANCPVVVGRAHGVPIPAADEHTFDILRLCEGVGYIDATTVLEF